MFGQFATKLKDSFVSILPIMFLVIILSVCFVPLPFETILNFLICCVLLVVGISFFTLGADTAMFPIGQQLGGYLSKKKIWLLLLCCFLIGVIITIAEPDLMVLAGQISSVHDLVFIVSVSVGVGIFLVLGILRMLLNWKLNITFFVCYAIVFLMIIFVEQNIIPVSFDSGSVTTGPISVPFIMAFGVGLASVRANGSKEDSFGMIGFASVGPILVVMMLFVLMGNGSATASVVQNLTYTEAILYYMKEVAIVLAPITVFFLIFQFFALKLPKKQIFRILIGIFVTYVGIVVFLVGVSVGFLPVGKMIGEQLAENFSYLLIPVCALIGFCMAMVEPAVQVLAKQIEAISGKTIKRWSMMLCISVGVAIALLICAIRLVTHISILWFLVPTYAIVFVLSFFAPKLFVGVAFDSGGVATGAMATTFAMPLVLGACASLGGNVMLEGFGILAFCAVAPILVVLIFGIIYKHRSSGKVESAQESRKRVDIVEYD